MPVLSVNSIELHYLEAGSGQPVLLLHGLGSCSDDWFFQAPILAERCLVIAPDLRGHGQSSKPRGPMSVAQLAADIAGLMDRLDLAPAHIVGLSLGGLVGQQLAIDFPQKVNRLILVNTFAHLWPTSLRETYTLLRRAMTATLLPMRMAARIVAADLFPQPPQAELRRYAFDRVGANDLTSYRALIRAIRRFDTRPVLHRIHAPTLVITGDRDNVVPRGCQLQLVRGIPQVRWRLVRDSGHATPVDQPEEFNRLMLEFLKV
jgi:pimeloyl-ACP methyl ester carboxylesterase